jgi:hypothetical protein
MVEGNACAPGGTMLAPKDGNSLFVMTTPKQDKDAYQLPLKIRLVHDEIGLGPVGAARLVVWLCYAPTLGTRHPKMPAPLYWADGVAGISPANCAFRGINWVKQTP